MKTKAPLLAGLELGTHAFTLAVGEPREQGRTLLKAAVSVPARGIERGIFTDAIECSDTIARLIRQAEEAMGLDVPAVVSTVYGNHLKSMNATASIPLTNPEVEISHREVERVIAACRTLSLDYDRQILHAFERGFTVDDQPGIKDPMGLYGTKLGVELHLVTAQTLAMQNLTQVIHRAGLELKEAVLPGLAAAEAVLTELDKDVGVTLIRIGEIQTEAVLFTEKRVKETFLFPWGTDSMADSLGRSLKLPSTVSEQLFSQIRSVEDHPSVSSIPIRVKSGSLVRSFQHWQIAELVSVRLKELLSRVHRRLEESSTYRESTAGVVIVGSLARLEGFLEMAENLLNLPVRLGTVRDLELAPQVTVSEAHTTAVGLLRLAALRQRRLARRPLPGGPAWRRLIDKTRQLLEEYF